MNDYYDQLNYLRQSNTFQVEEDLFSKGAQVIVLYCMKLCFY